MKRVNTTQLLLYRKEMESTTFFTSFIGAGFYRFNSDLSGQTAEHKVVLKTTRTRKKKKIIKYAKSKHNYGHVAVHIDWFIKIQHCLFQREL